MTRLSPPSLQRALLRLAVLPGVFLFLMFAGVIALSAFIVYQDVQNEQSMVVRTIARIGDEYLEETRIILDNLGGVIFSFPQQDRARLLEEAYRSYPRFVALYLLDTHGVVLHEQQSQKAQSVLGFDFSGETYFKTVRETLRPYFSSTFFSLAVNDVAVIIAQPIIVNGVWEGVLVGELNLYNLQETIQRMSVREGDVLFIVDESATLVAHPNRDLVRQQVNLSGSPLVQAGFSAASVEISRMDGIWVLASAAPMRNGWVVVTTRPVWLAIRPLVFLIAMSLLFFTISGLVFIAGLRSTLHWVGEPIARLAERADQASRGEYRSMGERAEMGTYRELNILVESFDRLLATIQARTSELLQSNQQLEKELQERQRIESELRRSEARYRGLFDDSPVAIWEEDFSQAKRILDDYRERYEGDWALFQAENPGIFEELPKKIRVLSANRTAKAFDGLDVWQKQVSTLADIFPPTPPLSFCRELEALWHSWSLIEFESEMPDSRGQPVHVIIKWSVLPEHQKTYDRVLILLVDITARRKAELALQRQHEQLEELVQERTRELTHVNQELESFAYTVSHDLRAPLRHISGFAGILFSDYRDQLDSDGQRALSNIQEGVLNMSRMIDGLLQLSRASRGELHYSAVDLSALAAEILHHLAETDPGRSVQWHISPGCVTSGDERLLRVALQNLLDNAWKFTSTNAQALIEFSALPNQQDFAPEIKSQIFCLRDNGVGFDMRYADKLFTPFQRFHSSEAFPGTGIGLATVQRIIRRHGGQIWCESQPGQGTVFYFTLG